MKKLAILSLAVALLAAGIPGARGVPESTAFDTVLTVSASGTGGASFTVPATGEYTMTVVSGAFCYLPQADKNSQFGGWLTQLEVHTGPVTWGELDQWGKHPQGAVENVGDATHRASSAEAETAGKGLTTTMYLQRGTVVTLLVSDGSDYYQDNLGSMKVRVTAGIGAPPAGPEMVTAPKAGTGASGGATNGGNSTVYRLDMP